MIVGFIVATPIFVACYLNGELYMGVVTGAIILGSLYEPYFISSKRQATLGMDYLSVRFATVEGLPVTRLRAITRFIILIFIGVIIDSLSSEIFKGQEVMSWVFSNFLLIFPYFVTKRKQMLVDLVMGMVALTNYPIEKTSEEVATNSALKAD